MKNTLVHRTKEKARKTSFCINAIIVFLIMLFLFQYTQEGKIHCHTLLKSMNIISESTYAINGQKNNYFTTNNQTNQNSGHNNTIKTTGIESLTKDPTTNPMLNKSEDNFTITPEDNKEMVKNGDAPFMTGAKERRTRGGKLQWVVSVVLSLVVVFFGYPLLFLYVLLNASYLANPNKQLESAYKKGYEARNKDKATGVVKSIKNEIIFKMMTLDKIFFADLPILEVNIFRKLKNGDNNGANGLRSGVATWAAISRIIAIALSFISLILGVIMLMIKSSRISGKAATLGDVKDFLTNMVIAILIALLINFALAAILYAHDAILAILRGLRLKILESGVPNFEFQILDTVIDLSNLGGMKYVITLITFFILISQQFKFVAIYINRLLSIALLTVIAPIISITYALDKIGDKKSQILNKFFNEYINLTAVGLIYPVIYLTYIIALGALTVNSPLLGLILILYIPKVEKTIKTLLGLRDLTTVRSSDGV